MDERCATSSCTNTREIRYEVLDINGGKYGRVCWDCLTAWVDGIAFVRIELQTVEIKVHNRELIEEWSVEEVKDLPAIISDDAEEEINAVLAEELMNMIPPDQVPGFRGPRTHPIFELQTQYNDELKKLQEIIDEKDRRIQGLLEYNNEQVERRREAERQNEFYRKRLLFVPALQTCRDCGVEECDDDTVSRSHAYGQVLCQSCYDKRAIAIDPKSEYGQFFGEYQSSSKIATRVHEWRDNKENA